MNPDHCHWCGSAVEPGEAFMEETGKWVVRLQITCNACVESWEWEGWRREES